MGKEISEYKCEDCHDTGFVMTNWADGYKRAVFCHCHPLVQNGRVKMWSGSTALESYQNKKRSRKKGYEVGD